MKDFPLYYSQYSSNKTKENNLLLVVEVLSHFGFVYIECEKVEGRSRLVVKSLGVL